MTEETAAQRPPSASQMEASASLLEDASTLLMFHNTITSQSSDHEPEKQQTQQQQLLPNATVTKGASSLSPTTTEVQPVVKSRPVPVLPQRMSGISSPGPAIAALAESDSDGSDKEGKNSKAKVAAAALAAAADMPMPPLRNSQAGSADDTLRGVIAERARTSAETILRPAETAVTKEQLQALQEKAEMVRQSEEFTAKAIEDDARSDATTADMNRDDEDDQQNNPKDETSDEKDTVSDETQDEKLEATNSAPPRKKKKTKTDDLLDDYIVDPDSGIITCICSLSHDDGYTIQCDHCNRWQHLLCFGIDLEDIPENFQCNVCQPRKLDGKKARTLQLKRIEEAKEADVDSDEGETAENGANEGSGIKDTKPINTKPKPKPPTNAYGKNLEETDIPVPEGSDAHKVAYYNLSTYDYQDNEVYRFVQDNIKQSTEPTIIHMTKDQFEDAPFAKFEVKSYTEVNNKKFNGIAKLGLFAEENIESNAFVHEYLGEIGFKQNYIADSRNQYRIWGVEKPYASFIPYTSLVIDARLSGNSARFIRRSCNPNCEIRIVNIDQSEIKFIIVALKPIKSGTELTLQWNWDAQHPIRNVIEGNTFDSTSDSDKPCLVLSVESVLTFVECACPQSNECALSKVKKASAHIYRSTRKGNSTSGLKLLPKEAVYISIQDRLLARTNVSLCDTEQRVKNLIPLLQTSSTITEAEITARPYVFGYLKKRPFSDSEEKAEVSLSIPVEILPEVEKVRPTADAPAKPVKKLSFADYKRKKNTA